MIVMYGMCVCMLFMRVMYVCYARMLWCVLLRYVRIMCCVCMVYMEVMYTCMVCMYCVRFICIVCTYVCRCTQATFVMYACTLGARVCNVCM